MNLNQRIFPEMLYIIISKLTNRINIDNGKL